LNIESFLPRHSWRFRFLAPSYGTFQPLRPLALSCRPCRKYFRYVFSPTFFGVVEALLRFSADGPLRVSGFSVLLYSSAFHGDFLWASAAFPHAPVRSNALRNALILLVRRSTPAFFILHPWTRARMFFYLGPDQTSCLCLLGISVLWSVASSLPPIRQKPSAWLVCSAFFFSRVPSHPPVFYYYRLLQLQLLTSHYRQTPFLFS